MGLTATGETEAGAIAPPAKGMADTPAILADTLVRAVGPSRGSTWLDPSAGGGQLARAAIRAGVSAEKIVAVDLRTDLPELAAIGVESVLGIDFLRWANLTHRRFDYVIANPPYVRLRDLHQVLFDTAIATRLNGVGVSATTNYWVPFLIAGIKLLKPGGSLAYILPAAWEYANYARAVRGLCSESFRELDIHRVSVPMFENVDDGCVLLVGRGFGKLPTRLPRVFRHSTLRALSRAIDTSDSGDTELYFEEMSDHDDPPEEGYTRMDQIAHIRVGAVTGDVSYFLLRESQRVELNLPKSSVHPILSKARHLVKPEAHYTMWRDLLKLDERVWLFRPTEDDLLEPSVRAYVRLPPENGGCRRSAFKVRDRDPWYQVPLPARFDGFLTGMSNAITWVTMNRMPDLTISNTLYGIRFRRATSLDEQAAWYLSMLSSTTARSRVRLTREYPQGLSKLEPGDFGQLVIQRPTSTAGALMLYRKAVELIIAGDREAAQGLADDWLAS